MHMQKFCTEVTILPKWNMLQLFFWFCFFGFVLGVMAKLIERFICQDGSGFYSCLIPLCLISDTFVSAGQHRQITGFQSGD